MSYIEEILIEAWNLGIKDRVIEKVTKEAERLHSEGRKYIDREELYDRAFQESLEEMNGDDSRDR
jgi:hypothetical protein